jgi:hypothetical protein
VKRRDQFNKISSQVPNPSQSPHSCEMHQVVCHSNLCSSGNSPSVCAERKHIEKLIHVARIKGVPRHSVTKWIKRKEGELRIERFHKNGDLATSLPCVLCKRALDKYSIKWTAFHSGIWVNSEDEELPESKPTSRQNDQVFGRRQRMRAVVL